MADENKDMVMKWLADIPIRLSDPVTSHNPNNLMSTALHDEFQGNELDKEATPVQLELGYHIFVLGCPASGKGSICKLLKKHNCIHVSMGDVLRSICEEQARPTSPKTVTSQLSCGLSQAEKRKLVECVNKGDLLDLDILITCLHNAIKAAKGNYIREGKQFAGLWEAKPSFSKLTVLVDGFPREVIQAQEIERMMPALFNAKHDKPISPDLVLSFHCPKEIAKRRYLTRKLAGRLDDDEARFEKRFKEFEARNGAILRYYGAKVEPFDSSGSAQETYEKVLTFLIELADEY